MYLKSIEVQGFKSFANKIVFEFHNGITGIVGPNGSGKSNVADAVRWVLGEQRIKQLRGASMQDVIFSGTELRKPQGFAYVAITLDNSDHQLAIDYDEVTVSRRIYRSGESEYRINGSACRLKDVNELFYDTGIGKEGYSIIGQGQIDKILSGKPEERRELFDEAAGIVKFKRRKAIAQKKLEDEKQNLVRVTDILSELEKQVGPLAKQSETAREYLKLKEELKRYEVNLFLTETQELKVQLREVESKEQIVTGDLEETQKTSEQIRVTYEELDQQLEQKNQELDQIRNEKNQSDLLKGSMEGQINVLKEQINTEKINAEHLASRIQSMDKEMEEKREQIGQYQKEHEDLTAQARESLERQEEAEKAVQDADEKRMLLDQQVEEQKQTIIQTLNEKADLTAKKQRYETMLEQVLVRRSEVAQKLLKSKSDESVQEEQRKEEEKHLRELKDRLVDLELQRGTCEEAIGQTEQEVRRLNRQLNETQQEYRAAYTRMDSLKNLAERYDGYGGSIRKVMEVRDRVKGIHGVVADIISTKKEYETAIETALGGSIQNIVTDSETTAKQLIEYLKKNKFGRATFLPLTSVGQKNSSFNQEKALKEPGVIGLASTLVQAEKQYEGLIRYLLGKVVVVDQIDHAIALARKFQYTLRIVTLDGELLSAGGSMTGGAFKNTSNLLGRRREIEELEERCQRCLDEVHRIEKELSLREGELTGHQDELDQIRKEYQSVSLKQNTVQIHVRQLEQKIQEISDSSTDMVLENTQLEEQIHELQRNQAELRKESESLEIRNADTEKQIQKLGEIQGEYRQKREELAKDLSAIQLETAALQQKYQFVRENTNRIREEIRRREEEKQELLSHGTNTDQIIQGKQEEIQRLEEQIRTMAGQIEDGQKRLDEKVLEKDEISRQQKGLFQKREELSRRMTELEKEHFRLDGQKDKLTERLDRHVDYMWSEYEMTYSKAEALRDDELSSIPELKRQADRLKSTIRALGNVNVNAIEDYKEVSERYEFMKTQHEDLVQAEVTLLNIIEELDTGMRRQFDEKFKEIRSEFDKVFRELFGGGHGNLELVDGEDILEAGIQIISQPPGKKLQNMMQLSGGEKALTAIALLFAIQNLKPSPFCLLDEIEAALDDSNVDRFAGYLHKLTAHTQFIVITHRRGTMVAADRLYGITMQEKGVSTLVSVNLIEEALTQ